jgi:adenosylmethionine-8-amino-7-oxononanoate aminotransferase
VSGHEGRKAPYHPILSQNAYFISSCNPYRDRLDDETDEQYVMKRREELREKIMELGEDQVGAFILEPVAGAVSETSNFFRLWCSQLHLAKSFNRHLRAYRQFQAISRR